MAESGGVDGGAGSSYVVNVVRTWPSAVGEVEKVIFFSRSALLLVIWF